MDDSVSISFPLEYLVLQKYLKRQMNDILSGLPGVLCHIDDVLAFGATQAEHDDRLQTVLD